MVRTIRWTPLLALAGLLPLLVAGAAGADEGDAAAFEANCASCHGADGTADTPVGRAMKVPSLAGSELAEAEAEAICEKVRGIAKHGAALKKVEEADLLAACRAVKELAAAGS